MGVSDNICKILPLQDYAMDFNILNFVYERKCNSSGKYVIEVANALRLVTNGKGSLNTPYGEYPLKRGDLFITFQSKPFKITNEENLEYIYVSFVGRRADKLLSRLNLTESFPVFEGKENLIPQWESTVCSVTENNADLMAEGILLCALAELCYVPVASNGKEKRLAEVVKDYVDAHYYETDLTLESISKQHSYGKKYVYEAFKKYTGECFSSYIRKLRLNHSVGLMEAGFTSIKEIAYFSGFSDPLYFSKVFKAHYGMPPGEYLEIKIQKQ